MRITRSFRARVALAAVAAAAIVVIAAGAVLFATAGRDERRDLDHRLEGEARALYRPRGPGGPGPDGPPGGGFLPPRVRLPTSASSARTAWCE